jgi:hypothetical protein
MNEAELQEALARKKKQLEGERELQLSDNTNDYDQGSESKNEKLGSKFKSCKDNPLAMDPYASLQEKKAHMYKIYNDPVYQNQVIDYLTKMRQDSEEARRLENIEREMKEDEPTRIAAEQKRQEFLANESEHDRIVRETEERLHEEKFQKLFAKVEREREKDTSVVSSFFNSNTEEFKEYIDNHHTLKESPVYRIIGEDGTYHCTLHRYDKLLRRPDGNWYSSAFVITAVEEHIRFDSPDEHKQAIIQILNQEYDKKKREIEHEKNKSKEQVLKEELEVIESIKTPYSRMGPQPYPTKTKRSDVDPFITSRESI